MEERGEEESAREEGRGSGEEENGREEGRGGEEGEIRFIEREVKEQKEFKNKRGGWGSGQRARGGWRGVVKDTTPTEM